MSQATERHVVTGEGDIKEAIVTHTQTTIKDLLSSTDIVPDSYRDTIALTANAPLHIFRYEQAKNTEQQFIAIVDRPIKRLDLESFLRTVAPHPAHEHRIIEVWREVAKYAGRSRYQDLLPEVAPAVTLFAELASDFISVYDVRNQDLYDKAQYGGAKEFSKKSSLNVEVKKNYEGVTVKSKYDTNLGRVVVIVDDTCRFILTESHYVDHNVDAWVSSNVLVPALRWGHQPGNTSRFVETPYWNPFPIPKDDPLFSEVLSSVRHNTEFNDLLTGSGRYESLHFDSRRLSSLMGLITAAVFTPDVYNYWPSQPFYSVSGQNDFHCQFSSAPEVPILAIQDSRRILNSPLVRAMMEQVA